MTRNARVDLLKGLAIVGVIAQHGLTSGQLHGVWAPLWLGLAVPVFVVITALNLGGSLQRAGGTTLRDLYGRGYLRRRLRRLVPPLAVAWVAAFVLAEALGRLYHGPQLLIGAFPLRGPGDYYIPVVFQIIAVAPLAVWAFRRRPVATVALLFAIDAVFEVLAVRHGGWRHMLATGHHPFVYDACGLRYLGALALGLWLSRDASPGARRNLWVLAAGAVATAYLVWEHQDQTGFPLFQPGFERRTNFLAVGLAAVLVAAALRWLPRVERGALRGLGQLGRSSYHVFLAQIVWFGVWPEHGLGRFALGLVGSSAVGLAADRALPWLRSRSVARPVLAEDVAHRAADLAQ